MVGLILQFFRPIEPVNVRIILENGGRPSGEADVEFATHEEALKAMCKVCVYIFYFFNRSQLQKSFKQNLYMIIIYDYV